MNAPSFRALLSMTDRDIIRAMVPQLACFICHRNSGLNIVEVGELGRNEREGLRMLGAVIHCPTCGLLNRKMQVYVPMTPAAYAQLFAIGASTGSHRTQFAARPQKRKIQTGMSVLKKFGIDHLATDPPPKGIA